MTELLDNAVFSIQLGLDDYQSNDPRRPVSAVRNFYAGVLLLGKQCLLNAAPDADPMEVLASRFEPIQDGEGGVSYEPNGYRTIDFNELRHRFKSFELTWPDGDIRKLQELRNKFEHYHSPAPKEAIQQSIAACFPIVEGFFTILEIAPADALGNAWEVMLAEEAFFSKTKKSCNASFNSLPWGDLTNTNMFSCTSCGSSLIYQVDPENADPTCIEGRCKACGEEFEAEQTVAIIVEGEHGADDYISVKDGGEPVVNDCPQCGLGTYVADYDINVCFSCGYDIVGECARCSTDLTAQNMSVNNSALCDYCDHIMSKDD